LPIDPESTHEWQRSPHSVSQQIPSTQCPVPQSLPFAQRVKGSCTLGGAPSVPASGGVGDASAGSPRHEAPSDWQDPSFPARLQASQSPSRAELQQTPFAQCPWAHSESLVHEMPSSALHPEPSALHVVPLPHEETAQQVPPTQKPV
jgi:hypothetical protein